MDQKYIVVLELSGTQIKGAVASVSKHPDTLTLPKIEAIVTEDNAECVQYGRVQNLITAGNITKDVISRLQDDPILEHGTINGAYVAIGGRSLCSEQTSAEINLPNEMVISQDILKNLYIEAAKNATQGRKVLKVMPRKFYVDNQTMPTPVGALGSKLRGDFTLVTCNPINVRNLDLILSDKDRADIPVKDYVITQLALADMVLDEEEKQRGCVLVDLGHQTTTISIYKDRALQYLVTLPMGSQNITRDISMGMNVTMEKAENAKCVNGDALANNVSRDELGRMNNYVAARAYEIAANINANIGYAKYKSTDLPSGFVLAGRGARLNNFDVLLSNITKMPVRKAKMPVGVNFALKAANARSDDYMSLVALVLRVCRKPEFDSCVTFTMPVTVPETQVIQEPEKPRYTPVTEKKETTFTPHNNNRVVDDDDWDKDDTDLDEVETKVEDKPKPKEKKKRPDKSWLNSLKNTMVKLVSADDMEKDSDLD